MLRLDDLLDGDVSRETHDRLALYADLVKKWNMRINLIAPSTAPVIEARHIRDSAQLFDLIPDPINHLVDIGSGGGFPGIVVACLLAQRQPQCRVTLIESDQRKSTFLREVSRNLSLDVTVLAQRIESAPPQSADVVTARALAPLPQLIGLSLPHLRDDGCALFLKGRQADKELADARQVYDFDLSRRASKTDPEASILKLERLRHV